MPLHRVGPYTAELLVQDTPAIALYRCQPQGDYVGDLGLRCACQDEHTVRTVAGTEDGPLSRRWVHQQSLLGPGRHAVLERIEALRFFKSLDGKLRQTLVGERDVQSRRRNQGFDT